MNNKKPYYQNEHFWKMTVQLCILVVYIAIALIGIAIFRKSEQRKSLSYHEIRERR